MVNEIKTRTKKVAQGEPSMKCPCSKSGRLPAPTVASGEKKATSERPQQKSQVSVLEESDHENARRGLNRDAKLAEEKVSKQ